MFRDFTAGNKQKLMAQNIVLEAKELSFKYPGNQYDSVKDISLQIKEGSCLGIIGPNGAGKSTLISILCGLIENDKGQIAYYPETHSQPQSKKQIEKLIKKHVALIPQEYAFYPELTVKQNLAYFISLNQYSSAQEKVVLESTLLQCQLIDVANKKTINLSGGYKRRLNIAIAISKSPKIIFLDEPTLGIDPVSRKDIIALLQSLKSDGLTLIYTSHMLNEIEELCDDVLLLEAGAAISLKNLKNDTQRLSFELLDIDADKNFLQSLTIIKEKNSSSHFQLKIENKKQLKENLNILNNNLHNIKTIHFSRNSIDQIYFDSVKAKQC